MQANGRPPTSATADVKLRVRAFLSDRDFHSTHHENGSFKFSADQSGERVTFQSYDGVPAVIVYSNGHYTHEPTWYRNFLYAEEQARGLDAAEDLASPGVFAFSLSEKPAVLSVGGLPLTVIKREGASSRRYCGDALAHTARLALTRTGRRRIRAALRRRLAGERFCLSPGDSLAVVDRPVR